MTCREVKLVGRQRSSLLDSCKATNFTQPRLVLLYSTPHSRAARAPHNGSSLHAAAAGRTECTCRRSRRSRRSHRRPRARCCRPGSVRRSTSRDQSRGRHLYRFCTNLRCVLLHSLIDRRQSALLLRSGARLAPPPCALLRSSHLSWPSRHAARLSPCPTTLGRFIMRLRPRPAQFLQSPSALWRTPIPRARVRRRGLGPTSASSRPSPTCGPSSRRSLVVAITAALLSPRTPRRIARNRPAAPSPVRRPQPGSLGALTGRSRSGSVAAPPPRSSAPTSRTLPPIES